jgi:GMP reductase
VKIEAKEYLDYKDVLIKPCGPTSINSRKDVSIETDIGDIPIIVANMDTVGTIEMAKALLPFGISVALHKYYTAEQLIEANIQGSYVSIGQSDADFEKIKKVIYGGVDCNIMVDVANGYRIEFFKYLAKLRKEFGDDPYIVAGNVATPDILPFYQAAGVSAVKIGVGPGGQCRTRETAGVGVPQLTAVMDCAEVAHELGLEIIADGGINEYADFAKALGSGADLVMAGSIFAGHTECGGYVTFDGTKPVMKVYGMSSHEAQAKYGEDVKDYRASEGRVSLIPFKGKVENTAKEILGSLRSTLTYTNSPDLATFRKNCTFIKVNDTINRKYEKHTVGY